VEGVYVDRDSDDFSDTDDDENLSRHITTKNQDFKSVNMTNLLEECKGPCNDFFGSALTPTMIDSELYKLIFYKKDRVSGETLIKVEFDSDQLIELQAFA